jgi:hypothetical protein
LLGRLVAVCFDQTPALIIRYEWGSEWGRKMFTSAECQAHAEEKMAQAERDGPHPKRLITAAKAWFFLANQLRPTEVVTKRRPKRHVKAS